MNRSDEGGGDRYNRVEPGVTDMMSEDAGNAASRFLRIDQCLRGLWKVGRQLVSVIWAAGPKQRRNARVRAEPYRELRATLPLGSKGHG